MTKSVALLRGINVGGGNKIAMAHLRALAGELGWRDPLTYIQSGNLTFAADLTATAAETRLEDAIQQRFGLTIPVIVRSAARWQVLAASNPFAQAAENEPNRLMLLVSKAKPLETAAAGLQERAKDGERVARVGDALWLHYPGGAGASRLSPALIDRLVGSPTTARNHRTVKKLEEMLA